MLPFEAIERLGLGLAEVSPALSFGLELTAEGEIGDIEIAPSWVRVTRLTYAEAQNWLDEEPLGGMCRLARCYEARRKAQGAVSLELPEVRIRVDGDQNTIRPLPPLRSRDLVTEAMLMAGEAVALYALRRQIPIPFTTQDPPFSDERPTDLAGMFALRRAFRPSQYSTMPSPPAGLGMEVYSQATSPLRRYLDLVVHQQVRAHLRGENLLDAQEVMERVGATEAVSGSVRQAERLSRRHWTLVYLLQHPDWQGEGIVVERRGRRATVLIPALDLDVRVQSGRKLELNDAVHLVLRDVNLAEQIAHFQIE
jgi:exoribonuclease-2